MLITKVVIIINSIKYTKHPACVKMLAAQLSKLDIECATHDMASVTSKTPLHLHYEDIVSTNADLYIILDGAGFELRTENDGWSLNQVYGVKAIVYTSAWNDKELCKPYAAGDDREQLADFYYDLRSVEMSEDVANDFLNKLFEEVGVR